jgi:hypothetical protein
MKRFLRATLLVSLAASGIAFASGRFHGKFEERADRIAEKVSKTLELNDSQKTALQTLKGEILASHKEIKEARLHSKTQIFQELKAEKFDEEKVTASIRGVIQKIDNAIPRAVSAFAKFHATLTSSQRAEIVEKFERFPHHE